MGQTGDNRIAVQVRRILGTLPPGVTRGKCKTNKSYAIAHGREEWYEGE